MVGSIRYKYFVTIYFIFLQYPLFLCGYDTFNRQNITFDDINVIYDGNNITYDGN
jgi:hypothetical protein